MQLMEKMNMKRFWLTLGLVMMLTILAGGQIFAADFASEEESLIYMREEEKLARDVYKYLYDTWNLTIFSNIYKSEQLHMNAIKTLLDRYGIQDLALNNGYGEFANKSIQELYKKLIDKGSRSKQDALEVGVIIEELDIYDLEESLKLAVHKDVKRVYSNLMAASYNHLDAFESSLQNY